jgi:hypothetical protein
VHIRFYIEPATGLPHIFKHDVTEDEVIEVFAGPAQHLQAKRGALMALGQRIRVGI